MSSIHHHRGDIASWREIRLIARQEEYEDTMTSKSLSWDNLMMKFKLKLKKRTSRETSISNCPMTEKSSIASGSQMSPAL